MIAIAYLKKNLALFIGLLALAGCSKIEILDALFIPRDGYVIHKDIAYGTLPRQKLDVYVPDTIDASRAVVVFFYGGAWQRGSKEDYRFAGQAFASKGYVTVVADYRVYPEVTYPAFLEDAARAVAWTHRHIGDYGGNPGHIFLSGHSAGAYNAVMLAVNDRYIKAAGGQTSWIRGAAGIAGPYDFVLSDPNIIALFKSANDPAIQPITYVGRGEPPLLLLSGNDDEEVGPVNTVSMARKLRRFGNDVTERHYEGVDHIGMALALANGFRHKAPVLDEIDAFIRGRVTASAAR